MEFNPENLEPVWFCGYSEMDLNFFGFELWLYVAFISTNLIWFIT